jgi:hypothetical protein
VGFFVLQWSIPAALMWLIITPTSFISILLLYEFLVRRSSLLRFLFGMKQRTNISPVASPEAALAGGQVR